jgi:hypothetical protein
MTMIPRKRWWKAGDVALFAAGALFACPMIAKSADPSDETPAASSSLADAQRDQGEKGGEGQTATTTGDSLPKAPRPDTGAKRDGAPSRKPARGEKSADAAPAGDTKPGSANSRSPDPALAAEKAAIDRVSSKTTIDEILTGALPRRTDRAGDWLAGAEPLHRCGEPRWIEPCIPLPPCHPSHPPHPYDLVGVAGEPTCGPIYRGPCCPRTGTHDAGPLPRVHRVHDRLFDAFYQTK